MLICVGCGRREVMVNSGRYEGFILKVNPDATEIYVSLDEKRVVELYFSAETTVSNEEGETTFDSLEKEQSVSVEVKRTDDGMVPLSVKILDK